MLLFKPKRKVARRSRKYLFGSTKSDVKVELNKTFTQNFKVLFLGLRALLAVRSWKEDAGEAIREISSIGGRARNLRFIIVDVFE